MNASEFERKVRERTAVVVIVGLGYAGLPMAVEIARAGFPVIGYDVDPSKVNAVNQGRSPVSNVLDEEVRSLRDARRLRADGDSRVLASADIAIICVPTPLTPEGEPDMRFVASAGATIGGHLHAGMLVVLQSTCAPGTTRGLLELALARASGLRATQDFYLAFAPERIDPGNTRYGVKNTPKLVGGLTEDATHLGCRFYETFIDTVIPVSSPEVAEMAKLVENTFRFINISFVNEMALLCDRLGVNVWEVIEAAKSKPFAFMPHYPSAGVGGHCIPVVPLYLQAAARELGLRTELIQAATRVNGLMPGLILDKLEGELEARGRPLVGATILVVGITYKPDIADIRESAAIRVMEEALARGARAAYHDPLIPSLTLLGETARSVALTTAEVESADAVLLLTPHSSVDYELILRDAPLVIDTRSGLEPTTRPNVVNVWVPGQPVERRVAVG